MKSTDELHSAIRASETPALLAGAEFARPELSSTLSRLLEERGWRAADAIRACYLERSYGYQMFNGTRPPTRNFLLRLALALELGCRTVAFPAISTGVYHYPLEEATRIAVQTVRRFLAEHPEGPAVAVHQGPLAERAFPGAV